MQLLFKIATFVVIMEDLSNMIFKLNFKEEASLIKLKLLWRDFMAEEMELR